MTTRKDIRGGNSLHAALACSLAALYCWTAAAAERVIVDRGTSHYEIVCDRAAGKGGRSYHVLMAHWNEPAAPSAGPRDLCPRIRIIPRDPHGKATTPTKGYVWGGAPAAANAGRWWLLPSCSPPRRARPRFPCRSSSTIPASTGWTTCGWRSCSRPR